MDSKDMEYNTPQSTNSILIWNVKAMMLKQTVINQRMSLGKQ